MTAERRSSVPAVPCRWTATPRLALPPTHAPGAPATACHASTRGPITRAFLEVLEALLWGFHNSRSGVCFPSYEAIAAKAECHRSTVAEALKALEWAGVLSWQNRITRAVVRQRDLFGRWSSRWTVIRTSNAYVFRDPQPQLAGVPTAKSENPTGTQNQEIPGYLRPVLRDRIEAHSIANMDRDAVANRDRQLLALKATMA